MRSCLAGARAVKKPKKKKKQFLRQYVATASPVSEPANRNFDIHQRGRLSLNFKDRVTVFFPQIRRRIHEKKII